MSKTTSSFEEQAETYCDHPYFLTQCEHCGWRGCSNLQHAEGPDQTGETDVICHKCGRPTECEEHE